MTKRWLTSVVGAAAAVVVVGVGIRAAHAHHSFAMYDEKQTYVFTGVVTRISPDANHLRYSFRRSTKLVKPSCAMHRASPCYGASSFVRRAKSRRKA